jgi:hypothetical protein
MHGARLNPLALALALAALAALAGHAAGSCSGNGWDDAGCAAEASDTYKGEIHTFV